MPYNYNVSKLIFKSAVQPNVSPHLLLARNKVGSYSTLSISNKYSGHNV